jgi:hypothetical protein
MSVPPGMDAIKLIDIRTEASSFNRLFMALSQFCGLNIFCFSSYSAFPATSAESGSVLLVHSPFDSFLPPPGRRRQVVVVEGDPGYLQIGDA